MSYQDRKKIYSEIEKERKDNDVEKDKQIHNLQQHNQILIINYEKAEKQITLV